MHGAGARSEHEVTRLIQLTAAIAEKLDVQQPRPEDLESLKRDVNPEAVLDKIENPGEAEKS
jgi:hypothetical protein